MLATYTAENGRLRAAGVDGGSLPDAGVAWLDLREPTAAETALVERRLGIQIPSRDEMADIEMSSRLYHEDGAAFMTVTVAIGLDTEEPHLVPVTFIVKDGVLVTVRHAEPKPFAAFTARAQRNGGDPLNRGDEVMLGLLDALLDRMADALEHVGTDISRISREVFHRPAPVRHVAKDINPQPEMKAAANKEERDLEGLIARIGQQGDMLSLLRESLVSFTRLLSFHAGGAREAGLVATQTLQRDAAALSDHATFLSGKINLLLDATLGLISVEQNQIIKIFSVAAVCLMPPTLVASVYGMNFKHMPELEWPYGYPLALTLMVVSAVLPIFYFKKKGWF